VRSAGLTGPVTYYRGVTEAEPTTRERILDVSFMLFVEVGFAGTTVTEIEKRAGLASGSGGFYRHFHSKDELLRPAVEREVDRCMAIIARAAVTRSMDPTPPVTRREWLEQMYTYLQLFDPLMRLMLTDGHRVPKIRNVISTVLQSIGEQVSWKDEPELTVCLIALGGYHLLSEVQGRPFQGLPQSEFMRILVSMSSEPDEELPASVHPQP
jgi:AcrR family transcriptional regulator